MIIVLYVYYKITGFLPSHSYRGITKEKES